MWFPVISQSPPRFPLFPPALSAPLAEHTSCSGVLKEQHRRTQQESTKQRGERWEERAEGDEAGWVQAHSLCQCRSDWRFKLSTIMTQAPDAILCVSLLIVCNTTPAATVSSIFLGNKINQNWIYVTLAEVRLCYYSDWYADKRLEIRKECKGC